MKFRALIKSLILISGLTLLGVLVFFLSSAFFSKMKKPIPFEEVVLVVNGSSITRGEYENALKYYKDIWLVDTRKEEVKRNVKNKLIERELLENWAKQERISVSEEEVVGKGKELYGGAQEPPFGDYPELLSQARFEVLKSKFQGGSENWREAQFFYIKFSSYGASELVQEGKNPKKLAEEKTNSYYLRAQAREDLEKLAEEAFQDEVIRKLNDNKKGLIKYEHHTPDILLDDDPHINELIFSQDIGQMSEVAILRYYEGIQREVLSPWAYGFVKVTGGNKAVESSFKEWLNKARKNAKIIDKLEF